MLMGYIPTWSLISNGMEFIKDSSVAQMEVESLNLVGLPHEIKGTSSFRMQYNPATLEDSSSTANYVEHRGLGSQIPTYHYTYTETGPITIPVVITDAYDGPPHASKDIMGNTVFKDFENLYDVVNWFRNLTHKIEAWGNPPFARISLGKWNKFGVVEEISKVRIIDMYKNGDPKIINFSFTLQPDVMVVSGDRSFYEVSGKV